MIAHKSLATYFQWGPLDTKDNPSQKETEDI